MERGTSSPGNPIKFVNFPMKEEITSRNPDARRIPVAVISPIRVGTSRMTVRPAIFCTGDKGFIDINFCSQSTDDDGKDQKWDKVVRDVEKNVQGVSSFIMGQLVDIYVFLLKI